MQNRHWYFFYFINSLWWPSLLSLRDDFWQETLSKHKVKHSDFRNTWNQTIVGTEPFWRHYFLTSYCEGRSENNASYFILLAHGFLIMAVVVETFLPITILLPCSIPGESLVFTFAQMLWKWKLRNSGATKENHSLSQE